MTSTIPQPQRPMEEPQDDSIQMPTVGLEAEGDVKFHDPAPTTGLPNKPQTLKTFTIDVDEAWMLP